MATAAHPSTLRASGRTGGRRAQPGERGLQALAAAGIVGVHVLAGYLLLQVAPVREAVASAAPLLVSFIAPEPKAPPPAPRPQPQAAPPKPKPPVIAAKKRTPEPVPFEVEAPPPEPEPAPAPVMESAPAPVPAPPAPVVEAPPPQPRLITGVQYLRPPQPEYPALSKRMQEYGLVVVRVLIDPNGRAERVEVQTSSGFARLDRAALKAVMETPFKPHRENGVPVAAYALVPIQFELQE